VTFIFIIHLYRLSFSNIIDQQSSLEALPHLLLGLLEALGDEVDLLEGGDQTLLVAGGARVKHLHTGLVRQGMLDTDTHHTHTRLTPGMILYRVLVSLVV